MCSSFILSIAAPSSSPCSVSPPIRVEVQDFYGSTIKSENTLAVRAIAASVSDISGALANIVTEGAAEFDGIFLQVPPELSTTVHFEAYSVLEGKNLLSASITLATQPCQEGSYFNSGEDEIRCLPCRPGHYKDVTGGAPCSKCPVGRFTTTTGQFVVVQSLLSLWLLSLDRSHRHPSVVHCLCCADLPVSTGASSEDDCELCPAGFFQDEEGSTECKPCAAGAHNQVQGASECQQCLAGEFKELEGPGVCSDCPVGTSQDKEGSTGCIPCPSGEFSEETGAEACDECPAGTYKKESGPGVCVPCPARTYNPEPRASACLDCATFVLEGGTKCGGCDVGTYPNHETMECEDCPAGTVSAAGLSCVPCPAGQYQPDEGQGSCLMCPRGKYKNFAGDGTCADCGANQIANEEGSSQCQTCVPGRVAVVHVDGNHTCEVCPEGTFASLSSHECEPCPSGTYSDLPEGSEGPWTGVTACTACDAGTFSILDDDSEIGATFCQECEPGKFKSNRGEGECQSCTQGRYMDGSGAADCDPIPAGHFSTDGINHEPCPAGEYVDNEKTGCSECQEGRVALTPGSVECTQCAPGRFANTSTECLECPGGTVPDDFGMQCFPCAVGRFLDGTECKECPAGSHTLEEGMSECEACPRGKFKAAAGLQFCGSCPPNTISNVNRDGCINCPAGQMVNPDTLECEPCLPGNFIRPGGSACEPCPLGQFQPQGGASACEDCDGFVAENRTVCRTCPESSTRIGAGCVCQPGTVDVSSEEGDLDCQQCPGGAECTQPGLNLTTMLPVENYWTSGNGIFYSCHLSDACTGGALSQDGCKEGYEGPTCAVCSDGYYMRGGRCLECGDPSGTAILVVLAVLVFGGLALWLYRRKKTHDQKVKAEAAAEAEELERIAAAGSTADADGVGVEAKEGEDGVPYYGGGHASPRSVEDSILASPEHGRALASPMSRSDWSPRSPTSQESEDERRRREKKRNLTDEEDKKHSKAYAWIMAVVVVIALVQILAVVDTVYEIPWPQSFVDGIAIFKIMLDPFQLMGVQCVGTFTYYDSLIVNTMVPISICLLLLIFYWSLRHSHPYRRWCVRIATAVLMLCYPAVSLTSMTIFVCRNIDGVDYLEADYRIECYDDRWAAYVIYACVVIALIPAGWPIGLFVFLWRKNRQQKLKQHNTSRRLGHLYRHYTMDAYYWSVEESVRKLFLTSLIILFGKGSDGQLLIGIFISVLAHILHTWIRPFKYPLLNTLQHMALFSTWLTLLLGLALRLGAMGSGSGPETLSTVVLLLHYFTIIFALLVIGTKWRSKIDDWIRPSRAARRRLKESSASSESEEDRPTVELTGKNDPSSPGLLDSPKEPDTPDPQVYYDPDPSDPAGESVDRSQYQQQLSPVSFPEEQPGVAREEQDWHLVGEPSPVDLESPPPPVQQQRGGQQQN